jgi:hypothetical protein
MKLKDKLWLKWRELEDFKDMVFYHIRLFLFGKTKEELKADEYERKLWFLHSKMDFKTYFYSGHAALQGKNIEDYKDEISQEQIDLVNEIDKLNNDYWGWNYLMLSKDATAIEGEDTDAPK